MCSAKLLQGIQHFWTVGFWIFVSRDFALHFFYFHFITFWELVYCFGIWILFSIAGVIMVTSVAKSLGGIPPFWTVWSPLCLFPSQLFHIVGPFLSGLGTELPLKVFCRCVYLLIFAKDSSLLDCWLSCFCLSGVFSQRFLLTSHLFHIVGTLVWRLDPGLRWGYFYGDFLH